ncbi:MAG: peroxiredoxin family protein [Gemmataceae bacterium]
MNVLVWLDASLLVLGLFALCPRLWTWFRWRRALRPSLPGRPLQTAIALLFYLGLGGLATAALDVGWAAWEWESRSAERDNEALRTELFPPDTQAPDFSLPSLEGRSVRLSDFRGHKPVVLLFGSFS